MIYKPPSLKQTQARNRNWAIRQLRAYFHMVPPPVSLGVRTKIQLLIDDEIKRLGAESEIQRELKRAEAWERDS